MTERKAKIHSSKKKNMSGITFQFLQQTDRQTEKKKMTVDSVIHLLMDEFAIFSINLDLAWFGNGYIVITVLDTTGKFKLCKHQSF